MESTLTPDQIRAIASTAPRLFLEAAPGSGKTTVAAHRFAVQRFGPRAASDPRGVVAVSFTRAATWELRTRIQRHWSMDAIRSPHRAVTLDTLIADLLHSLLRQGLVRWPGAHETLDVRDTWKALVDSSYSDRVPVLRLLGGNVTIMQGVADRRAQRPLIQQVARKLREGVCTHEDVRQILWLSLQHEHMRTALAERLARTIRVLIVDEVFDGNELDLAVVELAAASGVDVTIIGDPWQALYRFRGARPDLVPTLVESSAMTTLPLLRSFRWRSEQQAELARRLRAGESTVLPRGDAADSLDVVLASEWAHLWELNASVLPLAFGSAKGNIPEAGATLFLDYVTRQLLGLSATYAADALATLRVADPTAIDRLDRGWPEVIECLRRPGRPGLNQAYNALVALLATETEVTFPAVRGNYTRRLGWLRERVILPANLVMGLTVHQAKGREWGSVGVAFKEMHHAQLLAGLSVTEAVHRQIYVACTRAKDRTLAL